MKTPFSLVLIIILSHAVISASELTMPGFVQRGSKVSVEYMPSKEFTMQQAYVVSYCFTKSSVRPNAYQYALDESSKAIIHIPDDAVFIMCKVTNGKLTDDNRQQFWDAIVVDEKQKPVENAYFRAAISYLGQLPENCKRTVSASKAEEIMQKELALYPDNVLAKAGSTMLAHDSKKITKVEFDNRIRSLFTSVKDWNREEVVRSAWRSFSAIGNKTKADSLAAVFIKQNPRSELAEDYGLDILQRINDQRQVLKEGMSYIINFPHSKEMPMLAQGLAPVAASLFVLDSLMMRYSNEKHKNPFVVSMFAFIQVDADSTKIMSALNYLTKERDEFITSGAEPFRPRWMARVEWKIKEEALMAQITATRGFIFERANQKSKAIEDLEYVVTHYPESCHEVIYDKLVSLFYEDKSQWKKAFLCSSKAIELSKANDNILKINKETFTNETSNFSSYDEYRKSMDKKASLSRRKSLEASMLRQQLPKAKLMRKDGTLIETSSLIGKTLIIDFWATWCGPCRASFPAMQKLYDTYKSNPNVEFLIVNCWERADDKKKVVDEFIAKNNYTFPVYFDVNDEFAKSLGVTGIPAKFFVSPQGLVQFKESGFQGEAKFMEDGIDKIELLQTQLQ